MEIKISKKEMPLVAAIEALHLGNRGAQSISLLVKNYIIYQISSTMYDQLLGR